MQKAYKKYMILGIVPGLLLVGCFKGEQTTQQLDIPENVAIVDELQEETEFDQDSDMEPVEIDTEVERELYLIDASGLVVPQRIAVPQTEAPAMQALQYLVEDGPVTELLPNGFQAVMPAGTEVLGANLLDDGTLIVDVSEEFTNYQAENELKIIQAMTYTLTQFDGVERIKLWINGEEQAEMPVNGTPIPNGYSKANGINLQITDKPNVANSEAVTVFFPKKQNEETYFIPFTHHVETSTNDLYTAVVNLLVDGPQHRLGVLNVFNDNTALVEIPMLQNGVLHLVFNEAVLLDKEKAVIADEVVETLVRTLTDNYDVEAVDLKVENKQRVASEDGNLYNEPVTKQHFEQSYKM